MAHYANATGQLGVPSAFADACLNSISETFNLYGIPLHASTSCGLGPKIRVSYQCEGRETVLEMMQSPNFLDVSNNCKMPLSLDSSCRRCLNTGILYLHRLIGTDDNVTLSICRNAVFVVLANQGGKSSAVDMAGCFFGVQGLSIVPGLTILRFSCFFHLLHLLSCVKAVIDFLCFINWIPYARDVDYILLFDNKL